MSLILQYKLDNDTPTIGEDSSGNTTDLTNIGVTSSTDPLGVFGNVANFDSTSYLNLPSANVPSAMVGTSSRSFSFWIYTDGLINSTVFSNGANVSGSKFRCIWVASTRTFNTDAGPIGVGSVSIPSSLWAHIVITFGSSEFKIYVNNVLDVDYSSHNLNTTSGDFSLGRDPSNNNLNKFDGYLSDFRVYDDAIDVSTVNTLYSDGPLDIYKLSLEATTYTHLSDLVWSSITGASNYTLTQETTGSGDEIVVLDSSTDLSFSVYTLIPNTSYEFRLYTNLDSITPIFEITEVTSVVDAISGLALSTRINNDFTILVNFNSSEIQHVLNQIFNTGDIVTFKPGKYVFVKSTETSTFVYDNELKGVLTPFESNLGSGQTFTLGSDSVTYNELSNEITVGSSTIGNGEYMILNGYKVTMLDFKNE